MSGENLAAETMEEDEEQNGAEDLDDEDVEEECQEEEDDEMEQGDALEQTIASLRSTLEATPADYDSRLELIRLLRKNGDLEALEEQRKIMSEKFIMPPDFWMQWIEDEKGFGTDKEDLKKLFSRAEKDFRSPEIYIEHAGWACGVSLPYAQQVQIMEEAVVIIGLRVDCAFVIWNSYIDLEKMFLKSLKGKPAEEQRAKIMGLYARLLRIPHSKMEESWKDYCSFMEEKPDETVKNEYEKALKRFFELSAFEEQVGQKSLTVEQQLAILCDYIEYEKKGGDPARIQMMYERALVAIASEANANLWLEYGAWLDFELKISSVAVEVYGRAVRHSPCVAIWQQFFTALERAGMVDIIDQKWQEALQYVTTAEEGISLYRTYIYSLRRRAVKDGESQGSTDYSKVLAAFKEGTEFLQQKFGTYWDSPKAQFRKNHAHFLYVDGKHPEEARKIWNGILASGSGHLAAAWIEVANLERYFGSVSGARKLLYRAINSASDHPHTVFDALIQFEREVGTLEELDKALMKVNAQVDRISSRQQKRNEKEGRKKEPERQAEKGADGSLPKSKSKGAKEVSESVGKASGKRSTPSVSKESEDGIVQTATKKPKLDKDGFVVPQLPAPSALKNGTTDSSGGQASGEGTSGGVNTIFISNLDFKLPKEKLMEVFPRAKDVRLVFRGGKLHKGYGYVDFENRDDAVEALRKDRFLIGNRPMYVSEYKPHDRGEKAEFRYATSLEKNKVFVNCVHYDATAEQLKEVFAGFGKITDVRIVTHKSGKSKGCAYVEFEDENAAKAATQAEDIVLLDRKLKVALSNPPRKQDSSAVDASTPSVRHRNRLDLAPRVVSMVPRALSQTKHAEAPAPKEKPASSSSESVGETGRQKLSNEQFRKFL